MSRALHTWHLAAGGSLPGGRYSPHVVKRVQLATGSSTGQRCLVVLIEELPKTHNTRVLTS